jgi:methionyl aminopeptidase
MCPTMFQKSPKKTTSITFKTPEEIEKMRVAGRLAAEVLRMIQPYVREGVSTEELDRICHDYMVNVQQVIPAPLNYRGFPKSICTSVNHVVCHGIPGPKTLKKGDILNIDITVIKDGYHGDTSRMFHVGPTPIAAQRVSRISYECLCIGLRMVQTRHPFGRHRPRHPETRRNPALLGSPRVLRSRHRAGISRGAASAALR